MNIRKKVFFSLLVLAFLFIFSKCVYAENNDLIFHFNQDNLTITDTNQFEVYVVLDDATDRAGGYSFSLDYNANDIRIDSITEASPYWKMRMYNQNTEFVFGDIDDTQTKDPRLVKVTGTLLNSSVTATIGLKECTLSDMDYEDIDEGEIGSRGITITKTVAQPTDINVPTDTGYQEGNEDPTPSTVTEEPTQEVTQIADNGSTGNVNVVDNSATPTPSKTNDNTKANKKIPQTGANIVIYTVIGSALFGSVLLYKKYSNK